MEPLVVTTFVEPGVCNADWVAWSKRHVVVIATAVFGLAAPTDALLLLSAGAPAPAVAFALAGSLSMSCLLALVLAPFLGFVDVSMHGARSSRVRGGLAAMFAAVVFVAGLNMADALSQAHPWWYVGAVVSVAATLTVLILLRATGTARCLRVVTACAALCAHVVDVYPPVVLSSALHHCLAVMACGGAASLGWLLLPRFDTWRVPGWMLVAVAALAATAVPLWQDVVPGTQVWRVDVEQHARYQARLAHAFRFLVDVDGDGFSPVAWGGDCDDGDPARNPAARERPGGGDQNCNGVDPPGHDAPEIRGLTAAFGDPLLPADAVDMVLVVTVDALRPDAMNADVMPNVTALARGGLRLEHLYAAGSRTDICLTLAQRDRMRGRTLGSRLTSAGIASTFIVGLSWPFFSRLADGFTSAHAPEEPGTRWPASRMTDVALAEVRQFASSKHLLWAHYLDPHGPSPKAPAQLPFPAPAADSDERRAYLVQVWNVDREIGRLMAGVRAIRDMRRVVVIVAADHAEALGEHGSWGHSLMAWEEIIRIPAVMVGPGVPAAAHPFLASQRDMAPTVLGAFGLARDVVETEWAGRSWWRLRSNPSAPLHSFAVAYSTRSAETVVARSPMVALMTDRHKMVVSLKDRVTSVHDLVRDPAEQHNLVLEAPELTEQLRRTMEMFRDVDTEPWSRNDR